MIGLRYTSCKIPIKSVSVTQFANFYVHVTQCCLFVDKFDLNLSPTATTDNQELTDSFTN